MASFPLLKNPAEIPEEPLTRDIPGLIRALATPDPKCQDTVIRALARLGHNATGALLAAARTHRNRLVRVGAINALAEINDPRSVPDLILLLRDPVSEVRWQAALVLGEIGGPAAVAPLVGALKDQDKYVRYGSALALKKTGYAPVDRDAYGWYCAGLQDWEALKEKEHSSPASLLFLLSDPDPEIRLNAVKILGERRDPSTGPALCTSLGDKDRRVRWEAVRAAEQCGISDLDIPRGLYNRPRMTKNPLIAGFLNFLLPGLGYGYIGKWWGIMIFQIDITATVWLFKSRGETETYCLLLPLYLVLALHAWYITRQMPEDPL